MNSYHSESSLNKSTSNHSYVSSYDANNSLNMSIMSMPDFGTRSSAYFCEQSLYLCKSHFDGYSCRISNGIEYTECIPDLPSAVSPFKVRDSLDICNYRRFSPQNIPTREPTTPMKSPSPAKRLSYELNTTVSADGLNQLDTYSSQCMKHVCNASAESAHEYDSKISASFSGRDETEMQGEEEDAYYSEQLIEYSTHQSEDTMNDRQHHLSVPVFRDILNKSMTSKRPVTSSPLRSRDHNILIDDMLDEHVEPDDLNDTLERVNHRLSVCGYVSPSPTRMAKRKRLMEIYVAELLQQERADKISNSAASKTLSNKKTMISRFKSRKPIKRTISVDEKLKLLL